MKTVTPLDVQLPILAAASDLGPMRIWPVGTSLTEGTLFGSIETCAWRLPLKQLAAIHGVPFDFVGTRVTLDGTASDGSTVGPTGLWVYGVDREHDGNGGYTFSQIADVIVANYATVFQQPVNEGHGPLTMIVEFGANDSFLDGGGANKGYPYARSQFDKIAKVMPAMGNPMVLFVGRLPRMEGSNNWIESYSEGQAQAFTCKALIREYREKAGLNWHYLSPCDTTLVDHWDTSWHVTSTDVHFNFVGYARVALEIWKKLNAGFDPPKHMNPFIKAQKLTAAADTYFPWGALLTPINAGDILKVVTWGGSTLTYGVNWPRGVPIPVPVVKLFGTGSTVAETYTQEYAPGMLL